MAPMISPIKVESSELAKFYAVDGEEDTILQRKRQGNFQMGSVEFTSYTYSRADALKAIGRAGSRYTLVAQSAGGVRVGYVIPHPD